MIQTQQMGTVLWLIFRTNEDNLRFVAYYGVELCDSLCRIDEKCIVLDSQIDEEENK